MPLQNELQLYNASAGSGKTYTLVKQYVTILLGSSKPTKYRTLLAITFTNKAVAEMKERVIQTLKQFSESLEEGSDAPAMLAEVAAEVAISPEETAKRAKRMLSRMLHDYASFDIVTIDTLTHRILRTFSKDLGLSGNFEVSLEVDDLYERAVDTLIDRAGSDEELTEILVAFALEKTDDDRSWDISYDLSQFSKLLYKETHRERLNRLSQYDAKEFKQLKQSLSNSVEKTESLIIKKATQIFQLLQKHALDKSHFYRGFFYTFTEALMDHPLSENFNAGWKTAIEEHPFYKKTEDESIKETIDALKPDFIAFINEVRALWVHAQLHLNFLKNLVPLSLLQRIHKEVNLIKENENILPISDFNEQIYKHLREQPAAFIYERLGERYTHFFIDEFQDTSVMQWNNLVPLIENALSSMSSESSPHSAMLVGDPKQAIYRWRGGKAEQFIDLSRGIHPFAIEHVKKAQLQKNWRSHQEIISFNNDFFTHLATLFSNEDYGTIYREDNQQQFNVKTGGYVSIQGIPEAVEDEREYYLVQTLGHIQALQEEGRPLHDICILTRRNEDGSAVAQYLAEHEINVVSSESLLLIQSEEVRCLHALLQVYNAPDVPELMLPVLEYISEDRGITQGHEFIVRWIHEPTAKIIEGLNEAFDIAIYFRELDALSLYEAAEYLIRAIGLDQHGDAYLIGYLEALHQFSETKKSGLADFLDYFEAKKNRLSIIVPPQENAVQLMSIHKSKGLEFPIVIYPFADTRLYTHRDEYHWIDVAPESYAGFDALLVSHSSALEQYGDTIKAQYLERKSQQEFDAINLLYVAFTRPVERLYVITKFGETKKEPTRYGELLTDYIKAAGLWSKETLEYTWGRKENTEKASSEKWAVTTPIPFRSSPKEAHQIQVITSAGILWNDIRQDAISYGNLIHELFAAIKYRGQEKHVVSTAEAKGLLDQEEAAVVLRRIQKIMEHPLTQDLFQASHQIYNERPIIDAQGMMHIPDRIEMTTPNTAILVDYKTGEPKEEHEYQLDRYRDVLGDMGIETIARRLIYINEEIQILSV